MSGPVLVPFKGGQDLGKPVTELHRDGSHDFFAGVNRYPHAKPFRNRFGTVIETIFDPKMVPKSTKNQSKINVCSRLRFLIDFSMENLSYSKPSN